MHVYPTALLQHTGPGLNIIKVQLDWSQKEKLDSLNFLNLTFDKYSLIVQYIFHSPVFMLYNQMFSHFLS